jgi:hypothetical protein
VIDQRKIGKTREEADKKSKIWYKEQMYKPTQSYTSKETGESCKIAPQE